MQEPSPPRLQHAAETLSGRFVVLEELVRNEAEVLLRAHDDLLQREVVLKQPGPGVLATLGGRRDRDRVLREARLLARVKHPAVVQLLDVLETPRSLVLVLEPVAGETLATRLERDGRLPPEEVRTLGIQLCEALHALHAVGIVHRGIAEHNVILRPDGSACLGGFVFAKSSGGMFDMSSLDYRPRTGEPKSGSPSALPAHPAPEQLAGRAADARSDVFGLGCVLYRCLCGTDAFVAVSGEWTEPRPVRELAPEAPRDLGETIRKCLSRSPTGRFPHAQAVRDALAQPQAAAIAGVAGAWRRRAGYLAAAVLIAGFSGWMVSDPGAQPETSPVGDGHRGTRPPPQDVSLVPEYSRSRAVVIGIGTHYARMIGAGFCELPNAELDARAIADQLLELPGWRAEDVQLLLGAQATRARIKQAIGTAAEAADSNECLLVYYAGHAVRKPAGKAGWIVPADASPECDDALHDSYVRFDEIMWVFDTRAKHVMVVLDCCYSGIAAERSTVTDYKEQFLTQRARMVLTSSDSEERAPDGTPGEHSPFAQGFLAALRDEKRVAVTASRLHATIQDHVMQTVPGNQRVRPVLSRMGSRSEFVFFLREH